MRTFKEQGLNEDILRAIDELGFKIPTPIQGKTIPAILNSDNDIIALAQTGTGKTAGFGLPIIQQILPQTKSVQLLILCPTRELCLQITSDLSNYTKYTKDISSVAVYGGASIMPQIGALKKRPQIVVGTPGRTLDMIKRKVLKIDNIRWLVLDEADEMLNMGFRDELDAILAGTPEHKQTLLFSATMPNGVRQIANNYMKNPVELESGIRNTGAENVEHHYYIVKAPNRYLALKRLADANPNIYGIVFCRTRHETKEVADKLIQDGYNVDALHGDLSQAQRDHVMQRFRMKNLQLLIATDVAARGIDVNDLSHIINYNLPDDLEVYIHRSGRTGRAGKSGISIIISHAKESSKIRELEKLVGKKFKHQLIPEGKEICEKRLYNLIDKIENIVVDEKQIDPFLPAIYKKLEWLDRNELIKRFVLVEFNRFLEYYQNAGDINVKKEDDDYKTRKKQNRNSNFSRFHINIGTKHNLTPANLIGLINDHSNNRNIEIGKIDMLRNFSFFEIDKSYEQLILNSFKGANYKNVDLAVQLSKPVTNNNNNNYSYKGNETGKREFDNRRKRKPKKYKN